jgi:UDP-N-acetylmuramyl pentapeptide phosphotransferase/UDP-N-acetylglucosamine-1-phosphate transferase
VSAARTLATVAISVGIARVVRALPPLPVPGWERSNFQGRPVSLSGGLAAGVAALAGSTLSGPLAPAALLAGGSAMFAGGYDDLVGARTELRTDKGLAGHLRAIRAGRVGGGVVKVAVIGAGALLAARVLPIEERTPRTVGRTLSGAVIIAGSANLMNLFDLRPGRAAKLVLAAGAVSGLTGALAGPIAATVGATGAILPDDLAERTMLGDLGANTLGALVGVRLAAGSRSTRIAAVVAIAGLTVASERVSFSKVIDSVPVLHRFDQLGRRPRPAASIVSP